MGLAAAGLAGAPALANDCAGEVAATGVVRAVLDGRTVMLEDGRVVRLAGIDIPRLPETREADVPSAEALARTFLEARIGRQPVTIRSYLSATDRYGRIRGYVFLDGEGLEGSIQHVMLALGLVRIADRVGNPACATSLQARERQARAAKLGLWADARHAARPADDPAAVLGLRGRLGMVEGRVLSVRESGATIYVNFGRRWSEDFTVTIAKRNARMLAAGGLDPKRLERRIVRVRGFVEERGGPWIEVVRPEQVEIVR
jgi:endonuclease YncB( thermonuclease family)